MGTSKGDYMRNFFKSAGIIVAITVIGFSMTGCPTDDDGDPPAHLGPRLELSGRVYMEVYNEEDWSISYSPFNGNLATTGGGRTGNITNGRLTHAIETPDFLQRFSDAPWFFEDYFWDFEIVTVSNTGVRFYILGLDVDSDDFWGPIRRNYSESRRGNSFSSSQDDVMYLFVDNDVILNGRGKTDTWTSDEGGFTFNSTTTSRDFNLSLRAGWNALHIRRSGSGTFTGTPPNFTSITGTSTVRVSLSNPSLRWVLGRAYDDDWDD